MIFVLIILLFIVIGIPLNRFNNRRIENRITKHISEALAENDFQLISSRESGRKEKIPGRFPKHPVSIHDFIEHDNGSYFGVYVRYIEFSDRNDKLYATYVQVDIHGFNKTSVSFLPYEKISDHV